MIDEQDMNILSTAIEVEQLSTDDFLKVAETLTRMGIVSYPEYADNPTLWQSCHILHKQGRYFIVHFKHLFLLDGKADKTEMFEDDVDRLYNIAKLLIQWKLVKPVEKLVRETKKIKLCVLPFKDKSQWLLLSKYSIGEKLDRTSDKE